MLADAEVKQGPESIENDQITPVLPELLISLRTFLTTKYGTGTATIY